ncbi:predicted protein [Lichtheimia corymbifera JMRC:FSU:9682]|uniref:Uncharacterized protein n=1 Tax=Lichtheimia corymbifera JMRC:FSU:9682 TaxID=1263082 RepID=A0A068RF86_9FUNG|nr:predicted protein [Lichtheimia corymbifera JMRC:FSU:9682]
MFASFSLCLLPPRIITNQQHNVARMMEEIEYVLGLWGHTAAYEDDFSDAGGESGNHEIGLLTKTVDGWDHDNGSHIV